MLKKLILGAALACAAQFSLALSPYTHASKLAAAELPAQLAQLEKKLQAEGFTVLGQHLPKGIAGRASRFATPWCVWQAPGRQLDKQS